MAAQARGPRPRECLLQSQQLAAYRPLVVQRAGGRPPRKAEFEATDLGAQRGIGSGAIQRGPADLHVGGVAELPEVEQRSEEHTSELQSLAYLVCRLLLEKKKTYSRAPP